MAKYIASLISLAIVFGFLPLALASDWEEEPGEKSQPRAVRSDASPASSDSTYLQGKVEHKGDTGNLNGGRGKLDESGLSGKAIDDELRGLVEDGGLTPMTGLYDKERPVLKGSAELKGGKLSSQDPDADDRELMVEWDRWRNRFLRAVQLGTQEVVNNPDPEDYEPPKFDYRTGRIAPKFPMGTVAYFSCQVTAAGEIRNLNIFRSSGFPSYDKAVIKAVRQLEGTRVLTFPRGSHRLVVKQDAGIRTASSSDFKYYHFGDVEKIRNP